MMTWNGSEWVPLNVNNTGYEENINPTGVYDPTYYDPNSPFIPDYRRNQPGEYDAIEHGSSSYYATNEVNLSNQGSSGGYWGTDENGTPVWRNHPYTPPDSGAAQQAQGVDDQIQKLLQSIVDSNNQRWQEQIRQFNSSQYANLATSLLNGATSLTGPADYFKFLKYAGGGQDILKSLYGDQARPSFAGPTGDNQALTIQDVLNRLGLGENTTPTPTPKVSVQGTPGENSASQYYVPPPNQVNPGVWDSLGDTGKQFVLGAVQAAGWDPSEFMRQVDATRPMGTAPRMTTTSYAAPRSAYGGAF